jgi:hypothetical protein
MEKASQIWQKTFPYMFKKMREPGMVACLWFKLLEGIGRKHRTQKQKTKKLSEP